MARGRKGGRRRVGRVHRRRRRSPRSRGGGAWGRSGQAPGSARRAKRGRREPLAAPGGRIWEEGGWVGTKIFRIYEINKIKYDKKAIELIINNNFYIFVKRKYIVIRNTVSVGAEISCPAFIPWMDKVETLTQSLYIWCFGPTYQQLKQVSRICGLGLKLCTRSCPQA